MCFHKVILVKFIATFILSTLPLKPGAIRKTKKGIKISITKLWGLMKITNFTYSGPDSDNDMNFYCTAAIENSSDFAVEMVKSSLFILNNEGVCVGGSHDDEEDTYILFEGHGWHPYPRIWGILFNSEHEEHLVAVG